ncbi:MAG: hypothetical protein ACQR33_00475 [Candidatus Saccharibacteria bacterium]
MTTNETSCPVALDLDLPHITVPEVWALDYDETLGIGRLASAHLVMVAGRFGILPYELRAHQREVEAQHRSFNAFPYIKARLEEMPDGDARFDAFGQTFLDEPHSDFMFHDADPLLAKLNEGKVSPYTVLTYGEGTCRADLLYQATKLAASGYYGNAELTTNRDKGPQMDQWVGPNGTYDFIGRDVAGDPIAVFHARNAALVDDKASSLANLQRQAKGALLIRPGEPRTEKQGYELPASVANRSRIVSSLGELTIEKSYENAACTTVEPTAHLLSQIVAFEPAAASPDNLNLYIHPGMSFGEIREAVEQSPAIYAVITRPKMLARVPLRPDQHHGT